MNKSRLEAFSDGVMAIIITIMVLELKVPQGEKLQDLAPVAPAFFAYVQSFWFVGGYWNNHHHLLHTVKKVTGTLMVLNLLLLFCLSLVPFATAWVGETSFAPMPVAIYAIVLAVCGLVWTFLQNTIKSCNNWSDAIIKVMHRQNKKGLASTVMYLAGIPFAFINPFISEGLFIAVAIMWLWPDKNIERVFEQE
ncbi:MAG TPA: TMEM175 family protein [Chitinophagales bacterium]|nr:TMEM175 family protein [Chitinophagales bacterium]